MRWSRLGTVVAAIAGTLAIGSTTPTAQAAPNDIVAIVLDGTGNGHGRGMSQWGAYGYAVDHGWTWNQILDHYYGGTESSTVPTGQRIRVRLTDLDGANTVGVVSYGSPITWNGYSRASMYAVETSNGVFQVYGSTSPSCPGSSTLTVPSGNPQIAQGSSNSSAVSQIQAFLHAYQSTSIAIDGDFGNQTRGYLLDWQNVHGLSLDGTWDPQDATKAQAIIDADSGGGFVKLGSPVTTTTGNPITFTTATANDSSIAADQAIGLCAPDRTITHYRGSIDVLSISAGNRVVNDVKVEDYLRGVVPKEIAALWATAGGGAGANAVRAQAVAARSYGLQQARSYYYDGSSTRYATTCDTTSCQVYGGAARRSTASGASTSVEHSLTDQAIAATANVVRRWPTGHAKAGQLVSTEFSASNGPQTAGGEFPSVADVGDDTTSNPNHRWTRVIDADTLESKYGLGQLTGATMTEAASSVYQVYDGIWFNDIVLTGTNDTERTQAWDFRGAFNLPSPGFTVRVIRESTTTNSFGMVGDSVGQSIASAGLAEFDRLIDGTFTSATINNVVSRCTVRTTCPGTSGVEQAALLPMDLDIVVVELGYNDSISTFASDVDAMMNALTARGVRRVAWVNMADIRSTSQGSTFGPMNAVLDAAAQNWPTLEILDWDTASSTTEARARWFSDGVHLTTTGQAEFALWLRTQVLSLAPSHYLAPPKKITIPIAGQQMTTPSGDDITVPATATAVSINITSVDASTGGHATVWPCATTREETANLNLMAGRIVGNNVIASLDDNGEICLWSSVGTNMVVDVGGWFDEAGTTVAPESVTPERIVDTRYGIGSPKRKVSRATPLVIDVVGMTATRPDGTTATVPAGTTSVIVNLAAVDAVSAGYLTMWPCSADREETASLNFVAGEAVSNGVVAPVDENGQVCIYSRQDANVVVDLQGWFGPTDPSFVATDPARIVDTRYGVGAPKQRVAAQQRIEIPIRGITLPKLGTDVTVPQSAVAAVVNVVATEPVAGGYLTTWGCDDEPPYTATLNYAPNGTVANGVIAPIGPDGSICIYTLASSHVVVDISGWLEDGFVAATPDRFVDTRYSIGPAPL